MKKIELYIIELLLFISIIIFNMVYKNIYLLNISILIIGFYAYLRFGIMKDNNYLKKNVTKLVISCILTYFITIYILGLVLSFHKTVFSSNIKYILNIIVLESLVIIAEEIIRYIICKNTQTRKFPIILYTIILSILNIILEINSYDLSNHEVLFIFMTTIVIPVIAKESLCSYLTYKVSYVPSLIYKLTINQYQYVLPIIPNLGNYLYAISGVALPYATYYTTNKILNYQKKKKEYQNKAIRRLFYIPSIVMITMIITLISGIFSHTILAIGSNSMVPLYQRGDAVIYKKEKIENVKIGEVIAFKKNGRIITHRVINKKIINNQYRLKTKGDANNSEDNYEIEGNEVLGVIKYNIKYIGYPTIWFNDIHERKETNKWTIHINRDKQICWFVS